MGERTGTDPDGASPSPGSPGAASATPLAGPDAKVPWRVFVFVGLFLAAVAAVYAATADEAAGTVMLAVASVLGLWCGVYLWRSLRRAPGAGVASVPSEPYLPDASPWPLGIGLGVTLVLNGLLVGSWFLAPGGMVLAVSVLGFARQSRHRL